MQTSTLHIKVKPELAGSLKKLSRKRHTSVGSLVRQAILANYQLELNELPQRQRRAIEAYQGEYISLGKLAEEMGMNVLEMRKWLSECDIRQNNSFLEDDVKNA